MQQNTTYRQLADAFFNKIKDHMFADLTEDIAYEIVNGYIPGAVLHFQSCEQDLDDRNDISQEYNFTLKSSNFQILVNYMVIEYLDANYILTAQTLKSRLSTSDFHALGNKDMLAKAMELHTLLRSENNQLAINKSYKNSELFDMVTNRNRKKVY